MVGTSNHSVPNTAIDSMVDFFHQETDDDPKKTRAYSAFRGVESTRPDVHNYNKRNSCCNAKIVIVSFGFCLYLV